MFPRSLKIFSAVALTALIATACSSGANSTSGAPTSSQAVQTGSSLAATTPIQIGTIGSYSGANASSESGAEESIQAWVKWTNAHGGVAGHPIKLSLIDDGGDAQAAATGVRQLISQDHVVAIVGEVSNLDVTWAPIADKAGIPVIGGLSLDLPFETDPNFYPSGANEIAMDYGALKLAQGYGSKFADIYCAESPVCAAGGSVYGFLGKQIGMTVPLAQGAAADSPSFTSVCQAIKSSGVESYTLSLSGAVIVKVADDCAAQGVTAKLVLTDGVVTPALLPVPGTRNVLTSEIDAPFYDDSVPATKAYRDALKEYAPSIVGTAQDNPIAQYAWDGGQLFAAAVQASGTNDVTPQSIKAGLYKLKNETLGGLAPALNFTPGKATHIDCTFIVAIQNGAFAEPDGIKTTSCVPDALVTRLLAAQS